MKAAQLITAAESLERESKRLQGVIEAAAVLRELGGLEAHAEECEVRVKRASEACAEAESRLVDVNARVEGAIAEAQRLVSDARADAERTVTEARTAAGTVAREVEAECARRKAVAQADVDLANDQAERTRANTQEMVAAAKGSVEEAIKEVAQQRAELNALESKIAAARAEAKRIVLG
jgi:hypothetical protein